MSAMSSTSFSSSSSRCASSSAKTSLRTSRPKRNIANSVYYGEELEAESGLFDHQNDEGGGGEKAKSKSPRKRKMTAEKPEKPTIEMKRAKKKMKETSEIETKPTGILIISGSPILYPLPAKTKYMAKVYTDSKKLEDHDLFEIADLEHQHRKLTEAFTELFTPGYENELQNGKLKHIFGEKKAKLEKLNADNRAPYILLDSAKIDLGVEKLPELGPNTYPLIRYINEAPFFELHTLEPEDFMVGNDNIEHSAKPASPGQVLGFADEESMSLSKIIYEFLLDFQDKQ